jgi:hypothetical protein
VLWRVMGGDVSLTQSSGGSADKSHMPCRIQLSKPDTLAYTAGVASLAQPDPKLTIPTCTRLLRRSPCANKGPPESPWHESRCPSPPAHNMISSISLPNRALQVSCDLVVTSTCCKTLDISPVSDVRPKPMTVVEIPSPGNDGSKFSVCSGAEVGVDSLTSIMSLASVSLLYSGWGNSLSTFMYDESSPVMDNPPCNMPGWTTTKGARDADYVSLHPSPSFGANDAVPFKNAPPQSVSARAQKKCEMRRMIEQS